MEIYTEPKPNKKREGENCSHFLNLVNQIMNYEFMPVFLEKIDSARLNREEIETIKKINNYNQNESDTDFITRIKQNLICTSLENFRMQLTKISLPEFLPKIKDTIEAIKKTKHGNKELQIYNRIISWILMKFENTESADRKEVIDITIEILANFQIDFMDNQFTLSTLGRDKDYSENQITQKIILTEHLKDLSIEKLIITLTDLIGTGEALQRINKLIVENEKANPQAVENLKSARVYLVPEKNKKIFAELESFYREFNIKEHDLNKEMTPKEIPLLKQLIPPGGKVLESGCGTGRLLLALKEAGYDISGYDLLPENVDEVLKEDPEADVSVDDWYQTKYPDENFDAVYSLGRNILHEYSLPGQVQLFREAARVLKKGGRFIFDVPDREKGMYAQNIRAYKEALNKEGIRNIREGTVYDSPNGEHFSTRYCFSREDIENLAHLTGFKIAEVRREELPTGKDDENLYYVLEKI